MLLIPCVWYPALLCHLLSLDMICVNATCLVSSYHICELCNAILLQDIIYVNYAMLSCCKALYMWIMQCHDVSPSVIYVNYIMSSFFCISHCLYRQCFYIKLLFLCISHLNWWWRNLEWKQGLQSRQCYLLKQISCWLQMALQRRIQRQMTSPIIPLRCMLKLGRVILLISCTCSIAMLSFYIIYTILNANSLVDTSYMQLPSAHFLSI